jgi:high-affinity K+ transport system ATPase subunit B
MEVTLIPVTTAGKDLAHLATLSSVTDNSPSGSAVFSQSLDLAGKFSIPKGSRLVPPSELNDLCGVDLKTRKIRKGTYHFAEKTTLGLGALYYTYWSNGDRNSWVIPAKARRLRRLFRFFWRQFA